MSEEGGGKIRNKKVANQTKPYERRKSFLGKVTDTVKELISPSWLSDLVNSVKKPSPQKDEQPIPPAQEPQYMSSLQSHQQHNRIQSKDGYPPKFVPLTRNGIANLSPRASLPLAPSIPSHQSLQPQPTSTFSNKRSNIESPRTGDVSMKSQVQSNTFLQDSKQVNGNRNFLSDCTSGRDRLQSDSSAGPGDVIQEPSQTEVNPADISSACNHSENIDSEELEDTLPPSVNRLNKSTTWTEGFTARKQKFTDRYKPGFDISLFGAPLQNNSLLGESSHESSFYPGKTTYGGASAQSKRRLNVTGPYQTSFPVHQKMKVKPNTSKSAVTSSSAQKILESLEKMSTPLSEAKKIPIDDTVMRLNSSFNPTNYKPARHSLGSSYLNTRRELQKSQSGPPTGKLSTPVPVSISRNYQQVTLPQSSKSFLSEKSSTSSCQQTSQEPEKASSTISGGGKLKSKKFQQHLPGRRSAEDEAEEVEMPNLRTDFTLPVIGTPQFNFGTSQPTKSAKPIEKMAEKTNLEFKFSTPIQKTPTKQSDKVPSAKKEPRAGADDDHKSPSPVITDHSYTVHVTGGDEETSSWRHGRRVVELGVLADGLSACKKCHQPLHLLNTTSINTYGLSAILKVQCTSCQFINNVPTGKQHGRIWDANTKLASAMINAGVGGRQINSILSSLNIPPVTEPTLRSRQKEIGPMIELVAEDSIENSIAEEIRLSEENSGDGRLTVSVDGAWQKRGSGRSFDSLSGHCSMIGAQTGKVVYSGTASLNHRVAASVAHKNIGHSYVTNTHRRVGLSPGGHTFKLACLRDLQARKLKACSITRKAKIRRLELHARRTQANTTKEIREGTSYSSCIDTTDIPVDSIQEIPNPEPLPSLSTSPILQKSKQVYFDLESTGLTRTSHITQVAAVCGDEKFSTYVTPCRAISPAASSVTGLTCRNGKLFKEGHPIDSVSVSKALEDLIAFLKQYSPPLYLVGHNIKTFDCPLLMNALESVGKLEEFLGCISGFLDTKLLFRTGMPGLMSYSQPNLVKYVTGGSDYNAHDALADVLSLQSLVLESKLDIFDSAYDNATFSAEYAKEMHTYAKRVRANMPSLQPLIDRKILSESMARKVAGSGLNCSCLELAYRRNGVDGIRKVFGEKCGMKGVRVTKSSKIVNTVGEYFSELQICVSDM